MIVQIRKTIYYVCNSYFIIDSQIVNFLIIYTPNYLTRGVLQFLFALTVILINYFIVQLAYNRYLL